MTLRHRAVHADRADASELVMERSVRGMLPRMEQAAYDVLFNKATWRDPSRERRSVLRHHVGTTGPDTGRIQVTQGHGGILDAQLMDPFDAYPLDLEAVLTESPSDWWCGPRGEG